MGEFRKVVLSRKGFDSKAGGSYSPFDPQTGKYVVLPIPIDDIERDICNSQKYEDIRIQSNYLPSYSETNLKSLMAAMGKKAKIKGKESEYAHFDPWLGPCPWLAEDNHPIGTFGQVDRAQTHLANQGVGKGSLFLFFSRFTPIQNTENRIVPNISHEHLDKGLYFIYGWLRVKEVIKKYEDISDLRLLSKHPHATKNYFKKYVNNTLYIADKFLFNDRSNIPGCGYFSRLNKDLCLTASDSVQEPRRWIPSRWSLPSFFFEKRPSLLQHRKWVVREDGSCLVETSGQWQEAVFDKSEEFCRWFDRLLEQVVGNVYRKSPLHGMS